MTVISFIATALLPVSEDVLLCTVLIVVTNERGAIALTATSDKALRDKRVSPEQCKFETDFTFTLLIEIIRIAYIYFDIIVITTDNFFEHYQYFISNYTNHLSKK